MMGQSTQPTVSIIISTHNRAELLHNAISSVLHQTYKNWELIIWDDGSTDNTREVIDRFSGQNIRYFYDQNHGVSFAKNQAIKASKNAYLAFLDDDDYWEPEKLKIQMEILVNHPEIDVIFSDYWINNGKGVIKDSEFSKCSNALKILKKIGIGDNSYIITNGFFESIMADNYILPSSIVMKREVFLEEGFFAEELRSVQDLEYWWRLGLSGKVIAIIERILLTRNKYSNNLSGHSLSTYKDMLRGLDICSYDCLEKNQFDKIKLLTPAYRNTWQLLMAHYGEQGDFSAMFKALQKSLGYGFRLGTVRLFAQSLLKFIISRGKGMHE